MKGSAVTTPNDGNDFMRIGPIIGTHDVFVQVTKVGDLPHKSAGMRRRANLNLTPDLLGISREDFRALKHHMGDIVSLAEDRMEYLIQAFLPDIEPSEVQWEFRITGGSPSSFHKSPLVHLTLIEVLHDEEAMSTCKKRHRKDACNQND